MRQVSARTRTHQHRRRRRRQARAFAAEAHRGQRAQEWPAAHRRSVIRREHCAGRDRSLGAGNHQSPGAVWRAGLEGTGAGGLHSQDPRHRDRTANFRTVDAGGWALCLAISPRSHGRGMAIGSDARGAGSALRRDARGGVHESAQAVDFRRHQRNSEEHYFQDDRRSVASLTMNFEFSDEQQQLHDTVDRYLTDQYPFEKFRAINATAAGWDKAAWAGLGELGVLALNVPATQGGLGFGALETLSVMGACGKSLLLEPFLSSAVIATAVLRSCGDDAAAAELLGRMASGDAIAVLAHYEPDSRFESQWVSTRARKSGDAYKIDGHKDVVMHAGP